MPTLLNIHFYDFGDTWYIDRFLGDGEKNSEVYLRIQANLSVHQHTSSNVDEKFTSLIRILVSCDAENDLEVHLRAEVNHTDLSVPKC